MGWSASGSTPKRRREAHGVGFATHLLATIFWASFFESWKLRQPARSSATRVGGAFATAALAAAVDYTITPKRFTPGWEDVLSKRSMAIGYAAMALGFVAAGERPRSRMK